SFSQEGLGKTNLISHSIDVGTAKPIKQRHFPVSPAVEKAMYAEIDRMLQLGVIEESDSSWSSPIVMVTKPGKVRICLACCKVNSFTEKDAYPLPQIISEEGDERPIAFISKKLNKAQRNYTVTEQECLAAIVALKNFRAYVEGHRFKIITDHASLKWLMSNHDLNSRLARWALALQRYDFEIEYRKGSLNVVPDSLSRVNEDVIAAIDLQEGFLVDLSSDHFKSAEYTELVEKVSANQTNFPDLRTDNGYIYRKA
ncbi:hypothetical protein KR054_004843, partial [Drosophila jambulina]